MAQPLEASVVDETSVQQVERVLHDFQLGVRQRQFGLIGRVDRNTDASDPARFTLGNQSLHQRRAVAPQITGVVDQVVVESLDVEPQQRPLDRKRHLSREIGRRDRRAQRR